MMGWSTAAGSLTPRAGGPSGSHVRRIAAARVSVGNTFGSPSTQ